MASLDERIRTFGPSLKLGIDEGQDAVGIAVVRGKEILDAYVLIDKHDSTLEDRRNLRRGRRTRHAKKMRLARLRSWIFRQKILRQKLSNDGMPLDLYKILRDKKFQTKPDMYKARVRDPDKAPSWIAKAKLGEVDTAGFVMAVAQIFQKRGFEYKDTELSEMKDPELLEFLKSCSGLRNWPDLMDSLRKEIERRTESKTHKKFLDAFKEASEQEIAPRKGVPRRFKEEELRQIVDAFGKKHGLSEDVIDRWKTQLVNLLNKFVKIAKFDNRIISGCSWREDEIECAKPTPRLSKPKVRELAYRAAIRNLRIVKNEFSWYPTEPVPDEIIKSFEGWWDLKQQVDSGKAKYDSSRKSVITKKAPTKPNIEKFLETIGAFEYAYKDGKKVKKFAMADQLFNLLNPRAGQTGRANLCLEHLKIASEQKSDHQLPRKLNFRNPARQQHEERVISEIEKMLFIPGKKGQDAWRHGQPIQYITLEVPDPRTERSKKGEQPQRPKTNLRERLHAETGGVCIYTGRPVTAESMQIDHIVPRSRNGPDVKYNLVCASAKANSTKEKGKLLPSEWLNGKDWDEFEKRVQNLSKEGKISYKKQEILLLKPGSDFPDNPTPLARISGTHRMFAEKLRELFKKYGVQVPQPNYEVGKPLIQKVDGWFVQKLRGGWGYSDEDGKIPNFPEKDRTSQFNHAQDAAIAASIPPHTWRDKIFVQAVKRVSKDDGKTKEWTVARLDLAPDWVKFERRPNRPPMIKIFDVRPRWKSQLFDQTLWTEPIARDGPRKVYKPIKTIDENAKKSKSQAKIAEHAKLLKERKAGQLRQKVTCQPGGPAIIIPGITAKRPPRKLQVEPGRQSTGCRLWLNDKEKVEIALIRPPALKKFFDGEPAPPEGSIRLNRNQIIPLPATSKTGKNGTKDYPAGHYYIKEISKGGIEVIHERCANPEGNERKLGKTELKSIFFGNQQH